MIHSVKYKNFFSFKNEGELSFVVNDNAPKTEKYIDFKEEERLSKVLAVFGHNASGKTNALKTLSFLQWLIIGAYTEKPDEKIPVFPFEFVKEKEPVEVSVEFSIEKKIYFYSVSLTREKIFKEILRKKIIRKNARFSTLFERIWNDKDGSYSHWKDNFSLGAKFKNKLLRKNASVLATSIRDGHKESIEIFNFWKNISTNVTVLGKSDNEDRNVIEAAKFFSENIKLKKKADKFLQKFDIGLSSIEIEKKEESDQSVTFDLQGVHYNNYKLAFPFESSGTKKLFSVLRTILYVLETGGVAVLDEFDTDLHPMISEAFVEMFFSKEMNLKNAQLIFSAHSPHLLNLLDKYQISLTEKNDKGESEIWRLDEMEGLRPDDNYYAKYMLGAYGGVPNLDL